MSKVTEFAAEVKTEVSEFWSFLGATEKVFVSVAAAIVAACMVALLGAIVYTVGGFEEDTFHCGESERIVVKVEEIRYSKHNYGRGEVAHCVPINNHSGE